MAVAELMDPPSVPRSLKVYPLALAGLALANKTQAVNKLALNNLAFT
jgi:hypothetical protein